ncbi:MAG: O-antigen ligase family protein [Verrucomicrobiota bacterium]
MTQYLFIGIPFIALALCFTVPTLRFFETRPDVLVGLVVLLFVVEQMFPMNQLPPISLGGINVFPLDIVCPVLLIFAAPYVYSGLKFGFKRKDIPFLALLVWGMFLSLNFLLGIREYGIQVATNEFRGYLYIISVAVYVSTLNMDYIWPKIEKFWIYGSVALTIVALVGYTDGDLSRQGRPLDSTPTFFLLQAAIIGLFMYVRGTLQRHMVPFCLMLFPMLIILQHRSVWITSLLALSIILWVVPQVRSLILKWGSIAFFVFGTVAIVAFGEPLFEALADSYQEAVTTRTDKNTSTFVWRLQGWTGLITGGQMDSAKEILLGNPFGTGWERVVMTSDGLEEVRTESPHNYYLQTFLRCGLLGIIALLGIHFYGLRHLRYRAYFDRNLRPILLCLFILLACQMLFYFVYGSAFIQAVLLGAVIGFLRQTHDLVYS